MNRLSDHILNIRELSVISWFIPTLLAISVLLTLIITIPDYGLTSDEPYYIENSQAIEYWFSHIMGPEVSLNYNNISKYWRSGLLDNKLSGNVHPPFIKLSAIAFRHLIGIHLFDSTVYQYRVSTAFWASILVLTLYFVTTIATGSRLWGLLAGVSYISTPRFFAEAHLFTTDTTVSALGFCGLAVFTFTKSSRTKVLLGGVLFGAALATKFTGILAFAITAPLIFISDNRKLFIRDFLLMTGAAIIFFGIFNFPVLFNIKEELHFYFANFFSREKLLPISTLYFNTLYSFRAPFHLPWVMLGITLPPLTVMAALLGIFTGVVPSVRHKDRLAFTALTPFLLCMVVYMLPSTPKHDGIRLFSSSWPFIILLGIVGLRFLHKKFTVPWPGFILAMVCVAAAFYQLQQFHPVQLSYFNMFIGGPKGAESKGFVVSYWSDCFNRGFFRKAALLLNDQSGKIYVHPPSSMVTYNKAYGLFDTYLENTYQAEDDYRFLLVHNHTLSREMKRFLEGRKCLLQVSAPDGTFIGGLFENQ